MKRLAIETATAACSVALDCDGEILVRRGEGARMHAEVLLPWIEALLAEAGIGYVDLDALVVDRGPGGFTSLRLGLGVAQGIALACDLPCHPVSSLQALAETARPQDDHRKHRGPMLAALDARMGEIYAAWFDLEPGRAPTLLGCERLLAPVELLPPEEFRSTPGTPARLLAAGDALETYAETLPAELHTAIATIVGPARPDATALLRLAGTAPAVAGGAIEPVYLRDQVTS